MASGASREASGREVVQLRLLGFSTVDLLAKELAHALAEEGREGAISQADFGMVMPELLGPGAA
ncbi:MAG: hypothetical protein IT537_16395, partial [Hyphomicrobiales bacterium]|nr:hypothetical protein [Hyphomicrobiales bacterium]